ncbi:MAG TPA: hypothetical protein VK163_11315 [Opitutaceae bacterium]|nr:hypothetical protein [Opitutaceae bacterium]
MGIAGAIALALVLGAGFWGWQLYRNHLGESQVLEALDGQIGAKKLHFAKVALEPVATTAQERTFRFRAEGNLTGDLFVRQDTAELLRERAGDSIDRLEALTAELATPEGARLVELAKLGPPPADPLESVLLQKTASAGMTISATGQLAATRGPDGWKIEATPGEFAPTIPLGKPRANLPENALLVSEPTFAKTLADAVAARVAFAEKLALARVQVAEQLRQERDARQVALLVALQPGALFLGRAEPLAEGAEPAPGLVLEIATVKAPARQLTALLRNEGDWTDTRAFSGTWETNADFTALKLPLATRAAHAVNEAGPLLATREAWTIDLTLDPEGRLVGDSPTHRYTFKRVASAELERTRSEMSAAHDAALAATRVGTAYQGTVALKSGGDTAEALLRFTRQDGDGAKLEAELSLLVQPGRSRTFRGFVAANPHRTGRQPLRLFSEAKRRHNRAEAASVVGLAMDLAPAFAIKGDTLTGEDEHFTYKFTATTAEAVGRIDAAHQSAQASVQASIRRGAAYDGVARHRDGFTTPLRVRFTRADDDGTVEAVIESRERAGVNARLAGTVDVATRRLQLSTTGGRPEGEKDLRVPFLLQNAKYSLALALTDKTLDGTIEHDADWKLEFSFAGGGAALPTELPEWPRAGGAYVLIGDAWQALPTNNGRSTKMSGRKADPTRPIKVAELVFDGKDPVPALPPGAPVAVVFVGALTPPPAELVEKYSDALASYPGVELAPTRKALIGGKRVADLFRVTPEIAGFQVSRVAATLSEPADEITLLVANTALPSGSYALLANGVAYELLVK